MKKSVRLLLILVFSVFLSGSSLFAGPPKAPPKPAGPDKNSIEYKLDKAFITGFYVESCPASQAVKLLNSKKLAGLKAVFNLRVRPNQDRSITWDLKKRTSLRGALNQLKKYGYMWRKTGQTITITPVGKDSEWKTGYGSLLITDGDPAWLNRSRVRNAKFTNAAFADVEKLLRTQKYKVTGVGKTPVRITLAAGNVTLKQFLTAVCMASGFDCEVNKQQIRFKKGPGIGYYLGDAAVKRNMVKFKYPVVKKSMTIGEFLQKAPANIPWVFLHVRGINMNYYKGVVPSEVSGITMLDATALVEKALEVGIHYVANGVAIIVPHPTQSRSAFARRLQMNLKNLNMTNVSLKTVLDEVSKQGTAADPNRQGLPIILALKKVPQEKINVNIPEIRAEEFLRRLALATECYGYVSNCGTSYILVRSGIFGFKGIAIKKLSPVELNALPSGADCVDVPLDFASIDFKDVTVESVLKFVKVLSFVRFGNKLSVRWGIQSRDKLHSLVNFNIEKPTVRAILDALGIRGKVAVEFGGNGVYVKEY